MKIETRSSAGNKTHFFRVEGRIACLLTQSGKWDWCRPTLALGSIPALTITRANAASLLRHCRKN